MICIAILLCHAYIFERVVYVLGGIMSWQAWAQGLVQRTRGRRARQPRAVLVRREH